MNCMAIRSFRLGGKTYAAGDDLDLPANQFSDLSTVGLVQAAPETVKVAIRAKNAKLPNPGNVSSTDGAE